jgi:hypothetical protein
MILPQKKKLQKEKGNSNMLPYAHSGTTPAFKAASIVTCGVRKVDTGLKLFT